MADDDLTIKFRTKGQQLILVRGAPLASGAINALYVEVEFDPSWDQFVSRTVNFYKSYTTKSAMIPTGTNVAQIPHEITDYFIPEDTGHWDTNCWINVSGVGERKSITTNRLQVKIALGGEGEAITDPTPTLYAQLLNAIESGSIVAVSSVNGKTGRVELSTDDIPEGAENKYMTAEEREKLANIPEGGATKNHDELEHRDYENSHPIEAITNLRKELDEKNEDIKLSLVDGKICITFEV